MKLTMQELQELALWFIEEQLICSAFEEFLTKKGYSKEEIYNAWEE